MTGVTPRRAALLAASNLGVNVRSLSPKRKKDDAEGKKGALGQFVNENMADVLQLVYEFCVALIVHPGMRLLHGI